MAGHRLAHADPDVPAFSDQDLESAKIVKRFLDASVPAEHLREFRACLATP